ncbi:DUF1254 domain-containing protein [Bauldia sp.]|uniref:DUF1254 domain-containing protein n=1 Tax=Bauldia sp. TaxID=2575872 RepID=UPI003BA886B7
MNRTWLYVVGGVLLAGVIHIATVVMVPYFATDDAWSAMTTFGREDTFHTLPRTEAGAEPLASLDPHMLYAVCRFSLTDGPLRITATLPNDFWSIAVFDRRGRNRFSLNQRSAERSELDMAVITPVQMAQLRQDPPSALETAIVVEIPLQQGFALIRVFVADETLLPQARAALDTADCAGSL